MKILLVLAILAVLLICVWLFKRLNVGNVDKPISEERKKYFPAQMKPPKEPN